MSRAASSDGASRRSAARNWESASTGALCNARGRSRKPARRVFNHSACGQRGRRKGYLTLRRSTAAGQRSRFGRWRCAQCLITACMARLVLSAGADCSGQHPKRQPMTCGTAVALRLGWWDKCDGGYTCYGPPYGNTEPPDLYVYDHRTGPTWTGNGWAYLPVGRYRPRPPEYVGAAAPSAAARPIATTMTTTRVRRTTRRHRPAAADEVKSAGRDSASAMPAVLAANRQASRTLATLSL